jgi:hypothetical protein
MKETSSGGYTYPGSVKEESEKKRSVVPNKEATA